ncbi:CDGSH iron-sulfur domain-containing protein [Streptomyces sp. NPDC008001]|uniref:CDGSH iron-sulfur domain-containing protein n=1 Tax=Streptomyces sp. NPDC008001 TaxID=3364804 RepID=UPI0036E70FB2
MPAAPEPAAEPASEAAAPDPQRPARRVRLVPGGPMLVEGPVEAAAEDGTLVRSDRPVVALCTCRRSGVFPWCDTSHRRRSVPPEGGRGARPDVPRPGPEYDEEQLISPQSGRNPGIGGSARTSDGK